MKHTFTTVRAALAPLNVTIRKTDCGEYLVRRKGSPNGEGYFTTDLGDALATGQRMVTNPPDFRDADRERESRMFAGNLRDE